MASHEDVCKPLVGLNNTEEVKVKIKEEPINFIDVAPAELDRPVKQQECEEPVNPMTLVEASLEVSQNEDRDSCSMKMDSTEEVKVEPESLDFSDEPTVFAAQEANSEESAQPWGWKGMKSEAADPGTSGLSLRRQHNPYHTSRGEELVQQDDVTQLEVSAEDIKSASAELFVGISSVANVHYTDQELLYMGDEIPETGENGDCSRSGYSSAAQDGWCAGDAAARRFKQCFYRGTNVSTDCCTADECPVQPSSSSVLKSENKAEEEDEPAQQTTLRKRTLRESARSIIENGLLKEKPTIDCPDCGKLFDAKKKMRRHRLIHSQEKPFECPYCWEKFTDRSNMNRHQLVHTGEEPFECTECGERFTRRDKLTTHTIVHTGVKPFSCPDCGEGFTRKDHIKVHRLTHTGERPFECPDCGETFTQKDNMKRHRLTHTGVKPFECPDCGERFTQKGSMKSHRLSHAGVKPFQCPDCGERFTRRGSVKSHRLIHSGERPFECPDCGERFTQRSNMRRHRKKHADAAHETSTLIDPLFIKCENYS